MIRKTIISSIIFLSISNNSWSKQGAYVGGGLNAIGYSSSGTMVTGGLFAGYGRTLDQQARFYLGGELGLNAAYYHNPWNGHARTDFDVTASILPGLMLTKNTLLYGKVGLNLSRPIRDYYYFQPVFGVGVQHSLTEHLAVRAEYVNYHGYHKNQGTIGLVYSF